MKPKPQKLVLEKQQYGSWDVWREVRQRDASSRLPDVRFCVEEVAALILYPLRMRSGFTGFFYGERICLLVSAEKPEGKRARMLRLTPGGTIENAVVLPLTLPRTRQLLRRVLGRKPVVGDKVWVSGYYQ